MKKSKNVYSIIEHMHYFFLFLDSREEKLLIRLLPYWEPRMPSIFAIGEFKCGKEVGRAAKKEFDIADHQLDENRVCG